MEASIYVVVASPVKSSQVKSEWRFGRTDVVVAWDEIDSSSRNGCNGSNGYQCRNGDGAIEAFDSDIGYSSICIDCAVLQMSILCSGLTSAVHVVVQCSWNEMCNVYRVSIRRR